MQVLRTSSIFTRSGRFVRNRPLVLHPARWRGKVNLQNPKLPARRSGVRHILSIILFTVGGILCTYVAGSYTWMFAEQRKLLHEFKSQKAAREVLTELSIPRIGMQAVVMEGTSSHSLLLGPGHMAGSAIPGSAGNAVIAGHRDTFFRHVHSLRNGDDIYILRSGKQFHYVVVRKKVVKPTDLSVIRQSKESELTLITCYPTHVIGPAPQRLIIVAKLAGS
jgi:LPXTG-site transpeptidase (sortase) family protein